MEMTNLDNYYCLILAGGKGRRLWPCSRAAYPKQFIDFFGSGRTQLQQTYDRMVKVLKPDHIFINTNMQYASLVAEQLPEVPRARIMAEPIFRNTMPSVAWAAYRISHLNPQACIIVVPSDQLVTNEEVFARNVLDGLEFVRTHDVLLTMGIKPTRPEPGYGYIQVADYLERGVYKTKTFTEKPDRDFARTFMESGEFCWNTGLFLANVKLLREHFVRLLPPVLRELEDQNYYATTEQEDAYVQEHFSRYPNMSIEMGLLDGGTDVCVMKCAFGWADLGTWHGIYEAMATTPDENVVVNSEVIMNNSHGNVVKLSKGRLGVIDGLSGFIVAEKDNVLLICKKEDSSDLVRKYVNEALLKKGEDFV